MIIALAIAAALGGMLVILLASASADTALFARHTPLLIGMNTLAALVLLGLVVSQLQRLWRDWRQGVFGARLKNFDSSIVEASIDLGAGEVRTFFRIVLPVIAPGVLAGALLAFTLSVDEFIIAYFTAGPGSASTTFPMQIYAMIRFGVTPEINAVATIVIGVSFFLVLLSQRLQRSAE